MAGENVTLVFKKTEEDMKLMAAFLAEMQKHGGEVFISQDVDRFTVILLGM